MDLQPECRSGNKPSKFGEIFLKRSISNTMSISAGFKSHCPSIEVQHHPSAKVSSLGEASPQQHPSPPHPPSASNLGRRIWSGVQSLDTLQPRKRPLKLPSRPYFLPFFHTMILHGAINVQRQSLNFHCTLGQPKKC